MDNVYYSSLKLHSIIKTALNKKKLLVCAKLTFKTFFWEKTCMQDERTDHKESQNGPLNQDFQRKRSRKKEVVRDKLSERFETYKNETYIRLILFTCNQREKQYIDQYVTTLNKKQLSVDSST